MSTLKQIYEYGLRSLGRFFTIHITVNDGPGNLASIIGKAAKAELDVYEVRHIRGVSGLKWSEVTLSLSLHSSSFNHQIYFLKSLVDEGKFPEIQGREAVIDHQNIYKQFDDYIAQKKVEIEKAALESQETFQRFNSSMI
eukprot:TRINITY_DN1341_c0_g2_i3.p1 TRINITY_DN1341_c0_g2~~TRINITY_DN1341_c0_g2_i3.p1  ORF type:complete len:140 (-),score=37.88 TRINITY_DN1341_c0_g2_i3:38-457(-)